MKISLNWLAEYLPGPTDVKVAADALTHGGLPVEIIEQIDLGNGKHDVMMDVEVTSNRSDCLSHLGVGRELAALLDREFADLKILREEPAASAADAGFSSVAIDRQDLCPHYTARVIRGVKIGPSPDWMQHRLTAIGIRPVNNVVDVTNYVLMETGQPLHAFDLDKLAGGQINVRTAKPGETIVSLDGHERKLTPTMLVIADATKPVAVAGVMGGLHSEVTGTTVNLLLESARFDPLSIRSTARALAMGSDSSYRYERGIDPTLAERASRRAVELIVQTAGGRPTGPLLVAGADGYSPKSLWLRLTRLTQVLGVEFPAHRVVEALHRLRLSPVLQGERVDVTVPSYRLDLNQEIDLIEETARVIGYQHIPTRDQIAIRVAPADHVLTAIGSIRDTLVAAGFYEALTVTFVTDNLATAFQPAGSTGLMRADARVRKADARLRPSLIPGLLEAVRRNETTGSPGVKFFEMGATFIIAEGNVPTERRKLALVGNADYRELRGTVETLLARLDPDKTVDVIPHDAPGYAESASGKLAWSGMDIGHIGKIDPAVATILSLRETPIVAEMDLTMLLDAFRPVVPLKPLPRFPAVRRDLSVVVAESVPYGQIARIVDDTKPTDLESVEYVTTYRGKPLEPATKSLTLTLVFRSSTTTLTSEAVESAVGKVVQAIAAQAGGKLRI
jgi:phenylalanyl-tRNA synthetase beta chain